MPSCSSGGGRTYGLDPEIVKSSSTSTRSSLNSLSPSSTLSESSNGPSTICTRKPRTQRKRPNQKYNEAAALLSTAYPNIFSPNNSIGSPKFAAAHENYLDDSSDLLLPFRVVDKSEFLLHHDNEPINFQEIEKPTPQTWPKSSPSFSEIQSTPMDLFQEDFDAESILDEEIEEGIIDTIMGDFCVNNDNEISTMSNVSAGYWCGEPSGFGPGFGGRMDLGFGFGFGFGLVRGVSGALRNLNEGKNNNWWEFPTVDVLEISPKFRKCTSSNSPAKKKKKKEEKLVASPPLESKCSELPQEDPCPTLNPTPQPKLELLLKLNYDGVLDAWSGHGSPFSDESLQDAHGNDIYARLAQIDLFSEAGGVREARVLRYKEKRRTRLFSKKIRYEVRKVNADQRPRNKGRFVRRSNSSSNSRDEKKRMKK